MPRDLVAHQVSEILRPHIPLSTLQRTLDKLRIVPVRDDYLEEHRYTEAAKHPGSWLLKHEDTYQAVMQTTVVIGMVVAIVATFIGFFVPWFFLMTLIGLVTVVGGVIILEGCPLKKPAKWVESVVYNRNFISVPVDIATFAYQIARELPYAEFSIGTLMQEKVILDPYLIVRYGNQEAVLGIWDGKKIIAKATKV